MKIPGVHELFFDFRPDKPRRKILLVILLHVAGWCIFFMLPLLLYPVRINDKAFIAIELINKSVLIGIFYLNYYLLIPRLFQKKKFALYGGALVFLFSIYFAQHVLTRQYFLPRNRLFVKSIDAPKNFQPGLVFNYNERMTPNDTLPSPINDRFISNIRGPGLGNMLIVSLNNSLGSFCLFILMGGFIRLAYSFNRNQHEKKALENANLNAELTLLKSQINPHFLFNTLNGIYSLAHAKSELTEHSILTLSELLRYMLYEAGEEKVPLEKDIQHLHNYIELQKLRLSQRITVDYQLSGDPEGKQIAPLLLISFVENAFKHGISYTTPSEIIIRLAVFEKTLTLSVSNHISETNSFDNGGLGLKNATRRLDLLYPGKHSLDILRSNHIYLVKLKINLESD